MNAWLEILIPAVRTNLGLSTVYVCEGDGIGMAIEVSCLCRSDQREADRHDNPERDPRLPWGDFPAAEWRISIIGPGSSESYGPGERIRFDPIGYSTRTGILGHAGRTITTPTYGCVRYAPNDLVRLIQVIRERKVWYAVSRVQPTRAV